VNSEQLLSQQCFSSALLIHWNCPSLGAGFAAVMWLDPVITALVMALGLAVIAFTLVWASTSGSDRLVPQHGLGAEV